MNQGHLKELGARIEEGTTSRHQPTNEAAHAPSFRAVRSLLPLCSSEEHFVLDFIAFGAKIARKLWLFANGLLGSPFLHQRQ